REEYAGADGAARVSGIAVWAKTRLRKSADGIGNLGERDENVARGFGEISRYVDSAERFDIDCGWRYQHRRVDAEAGEIFCGMEGRKNAGKECRHGAASGEVCGVSGGQAGRIAIGDYRRTRRAAHE